VLVSRLPRPYQPARAAARPVRTLFRSHRCAPSAVLPTPPHPPRRPSAGQAGLALVEGGGEGRGGEGAASRRAHREEARRRPAPNRLRSVQLSPPSSRSHSASCDNCQSVSGYLNDYGVLSLVENAVMPCVAIGSGMGVQRVARRHIRVRDTRRYRAEFRDRLWAFTNAHLYGIRFGLPSSQQRAHRNDSF